MTIEEILQGVRLRQGVALRKELRGDLGKVPITGLEYDSRRVEPGFLFFAFPGARSDGREFAAQAMEKGAAGKRWRSRRAIFIEALRRG